MLHESFSGSNKFSRKNLGSRITFALFNTCKGLLSSLRAHQELYFEVCFCLYLRPTGIGLSIWNVKNVASETSSVNFFWIPAEGHYKSPPVSITLRKTIIVFNFITKPF